MKRQAKQSQPRQKTKSNPPDYEVIAHTADIGLRCYGRSVKELFEHAAAGMFSIIATLRLGAELPAAETTEQRIEVKAGNQEELLIAWLSELLSLSDARDTILLDCRIDRISAVSLSALARFTPRNPQRYEFHNEIKAVTYHKVRIRALKQRLQAKVYFDV